MFEKSYSFGRYNHPENVPEHYWEYIISLIQRQGLSVMDVCMLYVDMILAPLSKQQVHSISAESLEGNVNGKTMIKLTIQWLNIDNKFYIEIENNVDSINTLYFIKQLTFTIWSNPYSFLQNSNVGIILLT